MAISAERWYGRQVVPLPELAQYRQHDVSWFEQHSAEPPESADDPQDLLW
ncbi:hypothetical protein [Arthrobacter castelli]|nr:hypothetical protein [Arthrobacter castelli]